MEGLDILNLTPHDIVLYKEDRKTVLVVFQKQKYPVRLVETFATAACPEIGNIPVVGRPKYNGLEHMPQEKNVAVIVSALVADYIVSHCPNHFLHVFTPDTGPKGVDRNADGVIIGTTRLVHYVSREN